jgi:hypothetical protein
MFKKFFAKPAGRILRISSISWESINLKTIKTTYDETKIIIIETIELNSKYLNGIAIIIGIKNKTRICL